MSLDDKIAFLMKINEAALKEPGVMRVQSHDGVRLRVEVPRHLRRLVHRAGDLAHVARASRVTARKDGKVKSRTFTVRAADGRLRSGRSTAKMLENVERIAAEAVEHCTAPPVGVGLKDIDHDAVARDADDPRDRRATRPSSIASSATRPTTPAPAS